MHTTPRRRFISLLLSIGSVLSFTTLATAPVAQAATTTCETNCLRVFAIKTYNYLPGKASQANVLVADENGGGLRGMVVQGEWTLPDKTTVTRYALIGVRGRAEFPLVTDQYGTVTFKVLGMTFDGYTYDPDGGAATPVSVSIGTPPPDACVSCASVTNIDMMEKSRAILARVTVADETGQKVGTYSVVVDGVEATGLTYDPDSSATTNRYAAV